MKFILAVRAEQSQYLGARHHQGAEGRHPGRGEGGGAAQIWPSVRAPEERGGRTEPEPRQQDGAGQLDGRDCVQLVVPLIPETWLVAAADQNIRPVLGVL